jgi:hypothetical protein
LFIIVETAAEEPLVSVSPPPFCTYSNDPFCSPTPTPTCPEKLELAVKLLAPETVRARVGFAVPIPTFPPPVANVAPPANVLVAVVEVAR